MHLHDAADHHSWSALTLQDHRYCANPHNGHGLQVATRLTILSELHLRCLIPELPGRLATLALLFEVMQRCRPSCLQGVLCLVPEVGNGLFWVWAGVDGPMQSCLQEELVHLRAAGKSS